MTFFLPACGVTVSRVRNLYARQMACPLPRINSVVAHPELRPSEIIFPNGGQGLTPEQMNASPEIAADPARLALWREERAAFFRRTWDNFSVFEVDGCGKHTMLFCITETDQPEPISCAQMDTARSGAAK